MTLQGIKVCAAVERETCSTVNGFYLQVKENRRVWFTWGKVSPLFIPALTAHTSSERLAAFWRYHVLFSFSEQFLRVSQIAAAISSVTPSTRCNEWEKSVLWPSSPFNCNLDYSLDYWSKWVFDIIGQLVRKLSLRIKIFDALSGQSPGIPETLLRFQSSQHWAQKTFQIPVYLLSVVTKNKHEAGSYELPLKALMTKMEKTNRKWLQA